MKNKSALNLLFVANGISGFSQGISMLAIPWYFSRVQDSVYFNKAYGIITLIVLFFGLYAGTLVDRFSRKNNFLGNSLICGALLLVIACVGFYQHSLSSLMVIAVFAITMMNYNIHYPTLYAFSQEISAKEDYVKVNSNIEIVGQSTSILSGGIAALMLDGFTLQVGTTALSVTIPKWEIWEIFMLNAFTYFVAAVLILRIKYTPAKQVLPYTTILYRIKQGFTYLKQNPHVFVFGLFSYSVFAMLLVEVHAVLPVYVNHHLNENGSVFAIADGIYAVGALFAGLFVRKIFTGSSTKKAIIFLTLLTALIFVWAFATKAIWIIYTVSIILGFTNAGIRVLRLTYLFNHIPNELMGRVNSIFNMLNILLRTLFIFIFSIPFFNFGNNIIWAYLIMALFIFISAVMLIINKQKTTTT